MLGQTVNGLIVGSMYALVALGFTLVFGVLGRLNFAHVEVFTLGGYAGVIADRLSFGLVTALAAAALAGGLAGLVVERISFRNTAGDESGIVPALSSMALGQVLLDVLRHAFGADPVPLKLAGSLGPTTLALAGVRFLPVQALILATTCALVLGTQLMLRGTALGRRIRAVADGPIEASLLGVDVTQTTQVVFFLSSGLAAVGGLLCALRSGSASADVGMTFGIKGLAIAAIGGMGDARGAIIAGVLVGALEGIGTHLRLGTLVDMIVWVLMIALLVARPRGLFGQSGRSAEARV